MWGQGSFLDGPTRSEAAATIIEQIVTRALAGRSDDTVSKELAAFGVSSIVALNPSPDVVTALDTTAGLQRNSTGEGKEIWSVVDNAALPTRRAIVDANGAVVYLRADDPVPANSGGTLRLAIPPDPNLHVFVGGTEVIAKTSSDWRATYALGSTSGPITFETTMTREWFTWIQLGIVILLVIFVFPPLTDNSDGVDTPKHRMRRSS
jgi:hypothetical protein